VGKSFSDSADAYFANGPLQSFLIPKRLLKAPGWLKNYSALAEMKPRAEETY
jgi:hypothetical protein